MRTCTDVRLAFRRNAEAVRHEVRSVNLKPERLQRLHHDVPRGRALLSRPDVQRLADIGWNVHAQPDRRFNRPRCRSLPGGLFLLLRRGGAGSLLWRNLAQSLAGISPPATWSDERRHAKILIELFEGGIADIEWRTDLAEGGAAGHPASSAAGVGERLCS